MTLETRTNLDDETLDKIQDLLQINVDSRDGFREGAEELKNDQHAALFRKMATEREKQAAELEAYVQLNGEEPNRDGSFLAAFHRAWMKVREALSNDNEYVVFAEAERGEDQIKAAYSDALKAIPGNALSDVLHRHLTAVKRSHDLIKERRDALKASK